MENTLSKIIQAMTFLTRCYASTEAKVGEGYDKYLKQDTHCFEMYLDVPSAVPTFSFYACDYSGHNGDPFCVTNKTLSSLPEPILLRILLSLREDCKEKLKEDMRKAQEKKEEEILNAALNKMGM